MAYIKGLKSSGISKEINLSVWKILLANHFDDKITIYKLQTPIDSLFSTLY